MQEKYLYEYAVIRVLPRVDREEFINVGIILFSKRAKYIRLVYHLDIERLRIFSGDLDLEMIDKTLQSYLKIADGNIDGGCIAGFDIPERFRWLTAVKSSCIQTSRPHTGFSDDLDGTVEKLFHELVL